MTTGRRVPQLFITGTDTGVGKTHVTCLIAKQLRQNGVKVAAYKPVCSGADFSEDKSQPRWDDLERLRSSVGSTWSDDLICPQRFLAPLAPPIAAQQEGKSVSFERLVSGTTVFSEAEILLIEGAGGWLSPVTDTCLVSDLSKALGAPVLIVARAGLGTINHTLLTVESVRRHGLVVAGIVLNESSQLSSDPSVVTNAEEIEAHSGAPVFGMVPYGNTTELHRDGIQVTINWLHLASTESTKSIT